MSKNVRLCALKAAASLEECASEIPSHPHSLIFKEAARAIRALAKYAPTGPRQLTEVK